MGAGPSKKKDELFWDRGPGGYFFSENKGNFLPVRNKEFKDHARPNSNAVAALNLLRLFNLTFEKEYLKKARTILTAPREQMIQAPYGFVQMLIAMDFYLDRSKEIAVIGPVNSLQTDSILKILGTRFIPNKTLAYSQPNTKSILLILEGKLTVEGKTTVYVCENNVCKYPTGDLTKIKELVFDNKKYNLN